MNAKWFEGKPCKRGHTTRYVSTRECVACVTARTLAYRRRNPELTRRRQRDYYARKPEVFREGSRRWAKRNPDKVRASSARQAKRHPEEARLRARAWYAKNKIRALASSRAYRKSHPEKRLAQNRRYNAAHPEQRQAKLAAWRSRQHQAQGSGVTGKQWKQAIADSLGLCAYCNRRAKLTLDHIEPLARGGDHDITNAATACKPCNSSKADTPLLLWLARKRASAA